MEPPAAALAISDATTRLRAAIEGGVTALEQLGDLAENLAEIAWDHLALRVSLAKHPETPPAGLARLAGDAAAHVRRAVAANPHTPPATLDEMLLDPDGDVLLELAGNPSTPPTTLESLAADESLPLDKEGDILLAVATNPATTAATIEVIIDSRHGDLDVLAGAGEHPHCPAALRELPAVQHAIRWRAAMTATAEAPEVGLSL